ncbi:adenylosuccinate lyase [bacterium]|nr:adenylosuccinate lyase [bacterium]
MIERYSREEITKIWDINSKFQYYLDVELAVCETYCDLGVISKDVLDDIKSKAKFDIARIDEIEKEVRHDVIAFLTCVNENVGENSRYIHMGLTSSDVIDTALALQICDASKIILQDFEKLEIILKELAKKYKKTPCIGRSHGIHAEPMVFGLKFLNWLELFSRAKKSFEQALEEIKVGQISGPVGTYSNINPQIEELTLKKLGLNSVKISTQVIARDLHARYMQALALIATAIEVVALEIRHLQRSEVSEVQEGFSNTQKGSSAMPHKKNPIASENLCGLARIIKSNSISALDNVALWHERDISHSSVERVILPDSTILIDYMLARLTNTLENLVVNEKRMLKNLNQSGGVVFSQKVLLALTNSGLSREEAYKIVQENALLALDEDDGNFKNNILNDKRIKDLLSVEEIDKCFDLHSYLNNIDYIYNKFEL